MPRFLDRLELPYSQQQVFDLVSDIERYPAFVPHIAAARIRARRGNEWDVDQTIRLKLLRLPFTTRAMLHPPVGITITGNDSRLGRFHEQWNFEALAAARTLLTCETEIEPRTMLLNGLVSAAFGDVHRRTMRAFAERARWLYR
jgi:coenzyme Q-binding protein COQ10